MNFRKAKTVSDIVQHLMVTCSPETSLTKASEQMQRHHCSSIVVTDGAQPVGIWTEADAPRINFSDREVAFTPISQWMSSPVKTIEQHLTLDEAAHTFKQNRIRHLLVTDDQGNFSGILSQSDIVRHQEAEYFLHMNEVDSIVPATTPLKISHDSSLYATVDLMREHRAECVVVIDNDKPVGLLTERDLIRLIADGRMHAPLTEVMSQPLICVPANMTLLSARSLMDKRSIRHLGVSDDEGRLKGLISFSDILSNIEHAYVNRLKDALADRAADLARSEQDLNMANALIDASMDGIMVTDEKGTIQSVNPAFTILTGYSEREALGKNASLISSGKQGPEFYRKMWQQIHETGSWQGEIWNRRKSGEVFPEWLTITAVKDRRHGRTLYAGIFSDITERKKSEAIIENLAYYDPLTKLPNRQLLFDRLEVALATSHRDGTTLAVIFTDLDHFKRINDSLGHNAGDQVLCEVSRRLQNCIREGDTVARIGGDEIILLLTELDNNETVYRITERAFKALERPIEVEGHALHITASMGCSIYPDDGTDRDTLLKNADIAMYRAKQSGRNGFQLYSAEMNAKSMRRLKIENRLRVALSRDEFFIHYQPRVDLESQRIVAVEALLRWQDQELGVVPPMEFIQLAEELGLIADIGAWVLKQACRQCRRWIDLGLPKLQVSVNVSPQQFLRGTLTKQVALALEAAELPPEYLDLEITESCLIKDANAVASSLEELRAIGVTTSMDDFGTGYSSLSLLKCIPLDNLKIDRSFVEDIPEDKSNAELVSTIILMAHNLKLKVVAEGVETPEQQRYLQSLHCDQIQGYHFSRPLCEDELLTLIQNHQPEPVRPAG